MKVVMIGSIADCASVAAKIHCFDKTTEIVLFEPSGQILCADRALSHSSPITAPEELELQLLDRLWERFRTDVRVRYQITAISPETRTVTVRGLHTGRLYTESYDKLILSPGAKSMLPSVSDSECIFSLLPRQLKTIAMETHMFNHLEQAENL